MNGDGMISAQDLTRTEFYADWLRKYDYLHSYGGVITRSDGIVSYISAMRSRQAADLKRRGIRASACAHAAS